MKSRVSFRELSIVAVMIALIIIFAIIAPNFATTRNLANVLRQIAPVVITGSAITLLMVAGELDLSVGGNLALTGVLAAWLTSNGVPIPLALIAGILAGALVGLVNAALVVNVGINSVIATLGTLFVARGFANLLTGGVSINFLPSGFAKIGTGFLFGIPIPVIIMAVIVAIFVVLQSLTVLGRYTIAIGSNREAAELSGIRVNAVRTTAFMLAGAATGVAGVVVASRLNSGQPTVGQGFEFAVIVAAVIGGTALTGGRGRVMGTLVGAAIVGILNNALNLLNVQTFWQSVILGTALVVAVAMDDRLGSSN